MSNELTVQFMKQFNDTSVKIPEEKRTSIVLALTKEFIEDPENRRLVQELINDAEKKRGISNPYTDSLIKEATLQITQVAIKHGTNMFIRIFKAIFKR